MFDAEVSCPHRACKNIVLAVQDPLFQLIEILDILLMVQPLEKYLQCPSIVSLFFISMRNLAKGQSSVMWSLAKLTWSLSMQLSSHFIPCSSSQYITALWYLWTVPASVSSQTWYFLETIVYRCLRDDCDQRSDLLPNHPLFVVFTLLDMNLLKWFVLLLWH